QIVSVIAVNGLTTTLGWITPTSAAGGTVQNFSTGILSPLFITTVVDSTTAPALSFTAIPQNINTVYAGPASGSAAAPAFRGLAAADLGTGPASTTTFLRGDQTWAVPAGGGGGGTPGSPSGSIQGNNNGVFAGLPGSTLDFVNGLVSLAPTGTGVALSITGDSNHSNTLNILTNSFVVDGYGNTFINPQNPAPYLGGCLQIAGDNHASPLLILYEAAYGYDAWIVDSEGNLAAFECTFTFNGGGIVLNGTLTDSATPTGVGNTGANG